MGSRKRRHHLARRRGLGLRRAEVTGQLFPGMVSVFRPIEASAEAVGTPYVVFAGNVGSVPRAAEEDPAAFDGVDLDRFVGGFDGAALDTRQPGRRGAG